MTVALDIVKDAGVAAGVIDPEESLSASQGQYILRRLNRMIASWANEDLTIYNTYVDQLAMTGGQASYSSSLLAHGNARQWDNAFVRISSVDYPLSIIPQQLYNAITYKTTAGIPTQLYINTDWPNSTLYFFPVPFGTMTGFIAGRVQIEPTLLLTDTIDLPPGYEAALVDNLAADICPSFGLPPNAQLMQQAQQAKMVLKRNNHVALEMITDVPVAPRLYNIFSGQNDIS